MPAVVQNAASNIVTIPQAVATSAGSFVAPAAFQTFAYRAAIGRSLPRRALIGQREAPRGGKAQDGGVYMGLAGLPRPRTPALPGHAAPKSRAAAARVGRRR